MPVTAYASGGDCVGSSKRRVLSMGLSVPDSTAHAHVLHLVNFPFPMSYKDLVEQTKHVVQPHMPQVANFEVNAKNGGKASTLIFSDGYDAKATLECAREHLPLRWAEPGTSGDSNMGSTELHLKLDQTFRQRPFGKGLNIPCFFLLGPVTETARCYWTLVC